MSHDAQPTQTILSEPNWQTSVDSAHIGITAKDGIVTYGQKQAAKAAAWRVEGVSAVTEQTEVRIPFNTKGGDDDIAAAVVDRLSWDGAILRDTVKVRVEKGWVTLTGHVDRYCRESAVEQEICVLPGVIIVSNWTAIKACAGTDKISDDVSRLPHRYWSFDGKTINTSKPARLDTQGAPQSALPEVIALGGG